MKVKRILTFILSLIMLFTCSVALAEEPEAEEPLESENELSVIMEDEIEIVQAEALLSAAPEEEQEDDPDLPDDEEDIIDEDESEPSEDEDLTEDEVIPDDEDDTVDEPEAPIEEPEEEPADEPAIPEEPTEDPAEEPGDDNPDIPQDLTVVPSDIPLEEPVEKPTDEPVEEPVVEPADKPEEEPEPIEEPAEEAEKEPEEEHIEEPAEEEPSEEEPEELPPHQAGDFVQVTKDTWVFTDMDKTEAANRIKSDLFVGVFVRDAVVQIDDILRDANGDYWYKVRYLYGDELKSGALKWTAYGSVYVLANETLDTDKTACTVTDYAYTKEQLTQRQSGGRKLLRSFSPTAMDGFSLKEIHVSLGSFEEWQSGLNGSSGKDSDYPQIAKSSAHGTIYATPHYLEGFEVYCLEHTQDGPGEGSGSNQAPKGPYVLVDMDTFSNTSAGGGVTGVRFSEKTMHALAWVLRHTYPFMVLDRSDAHNNTWSRVAGQFAMREVIKQLEGAQYVRSYWDMDNFYAFSGGAPAVYLTYARWLAANGIARSKITGKITFSNASMTVSGTNYIGKVTVSTDADLIRIPKSVGTLTGNSGGSDSSYYYAKSGDTISVTSTERKFTVTMESISSDSEEAHFLVGIPEVSIQKILVPTYGSPYPLKDGSVTFELALGEIEVTKKSDDGILLKNAVFELLKNNSVIKTATTNASGVAKFTDLEPGAYTVREKTPPQGYNLAATSSENVTVVAGSVSKCTFTNKRISGKVRIVKTDSQTHKPLAGATFTVTRLSGPESDHAGDIGKVVATITTNAQGIAETGLLPWGEYKIVETGVPDGYLDSGYTVNVWIK